MSDDSEAPSPDALLAALAKARGEIGILTGETPDEPAGGVNGNFTIHDIAGVGRYALPEDESWHMLLALVEDAEVRIGYAPQHYPIFDAAVQERHNVTDAALAANIAAVRNYVMQWYYAETPEGMTPDKIINSMSRMAMFVGNALTKFVTEKATMGDRPHVSMIDPERAALPDGEGAKYIYDKILEAQRQSDWLRPFAPITALFGGKELIDWKLPRVDETPFLTLFEEQEIVDATALANDLDALGDHLLATAERMNGVSTLSESVRQDAIEIAKEILRKLKLSLGDKVVLDGLGFRPGEDSADELGGLAGVAMIFELLLAWARGLDNSIMQHPTVQAAIRAVSQLGYIAKMESMRLAQMAGKQAMVERLQNQIKRMPKNNTLAPNAKHGELVERVENGINTVLNRAVEISGPSAFVGHTPAKQLGNSLNTPIAGMSGLASSAVTGRSNQGRENAAVQQAIDIAERAQAARIQSQIAQRQQQQQQVPSRTAATGRQALQQARASARSANAASTASMSTTMPPGQQNQIAQRAWIMRNAALRASQLHDDEEHHHGAEHVVGKMDPRILQSVRAATMMKGINPGQLMNSGAMNRPMNFNQGYGLKPPETPNLKRQPPPQPTPPPQATQPPRPGEPPRPTQQPQPLTPQNLPPGGKPSGGGGGGRGF